LNVLAHWILSLFSKNIHNFTRFYKNLRIIGINIAVLDRSQKRLDRQALTLVCTSSVSSPLIPMPR